MASLTSPYVLPILLLLASNSAPGCTLNSGMSRLLQTVFEQFSSHSV